MNVIGKTANRIIQKIVAGLLLTATNSSQKPNL